MKFNKYTWSLYKNSPKGKQFISYFKRLTCSAYIKKLQDWQDDFEISIHKEFIKDFGYERFSISITKLVKDYASNIAVKSLKEAQKLYASIVKKGIPIYSKDIKGKRQYICDFGGKYNPEKCYDYVENISHGLFFAHPMFFVPYRFKWNFDRFQAICEEFNIPIPPVPGKLQKKERALYYIHLNNALLEFGMRYGLTTYEICAFLYDFAPNFINKSDNNELPTPAKVWAITANPYSDFYLIDSAIKKTVYAWGGNIETKKGDILLMYEPLPRGYIKSIWRAVSDGFIDPFFHYYGTIRIGYPIKTVPVTFKDMKTHPILAEKGAIKGHMQGASGKPFTVREYQAILEIMKAKGQDISILPKMDYIDELPPIDLVDERSVEEKLVEPLLRKLGYNERDWIRQMPVRIGRGERIYPDYAFCVHNKKGEESARMILETKFSLSTHRLLTDAYYQAKSYALRLKAKVMLLASKEGLWIFQRKKDDFYADEFIHKSWNELNHPDELHKIVRIIGKKKVL